MVIGTHTCILMSDDTHPTPTCASTCSSSNVCISCPPHSQALPGSTRISDCLCAPGFVYKWSYNQGITCAPCPPGTYKPDEGAGPCRPCPAGSCALHSGG
jgi:hypothetical protein